MMRTCLKKKREKRLEQRAGEAPRGTPNDCDLI